MSKIFWYKLFFIPQYNKGLHSMQPKIGSSKRRNRCLRFFSKIKAIWIYFSNNWKCATMTLFPEKRTGYMSYIYKQLSSKSHLINLLLLTPFSILNIYRQLVSQISMAPGITCLAPDITGPHPHIHTPPQIKNEVY